ncbi:MAG: hypothetical protein PHP75_06290 [Methylacidiphilaceae bacterium]|nr:hypothetical protein [Candidatus Methylacidiphilaceae bacterium]
MNDKPHPLNGRKRSKLVVRMGLKTRLERQARAEAGALQAIHKLAAEEAAKWPDSDHVSINRMLKAVADDICSRP